MKSKTKIIIIILIISQMIISGCITDDNDDTSKNLSYTYQIEIFINESNDNFINVPLPLFGKDQPNFSSNDTIAQEVIDNIGFTTGYVDFQIITTIHGKALNISFNNSATLLSIGEIQWRDQFSQEPAPIYLSMMVEYEKPNWVTVSEKYWCYSSNSNVSLRIKLDTKKSQGGYTNYNSQIIELEKGWQIIDINESIKVP